MQLREIELKVQREINEKRQELLAKEEALRYRRFPSPHGIQSNVHNQESGK